MNPNTLKVFISWSGDLSRDIGEVLRKWLPAVIQAVKPYFTPGDIEKGARWSDEIAKELDDSRIGLICLTRDNLEAPWVLFEAGALSKNLGKSKVCPLLFGIDPTDLKGPLLQFQACRFTKGDMKKVVKSINKELGEAALAGDVLESVYDRWWPDLESEVSEVLAGDRGTVAGPVRSDRELLEEALQLLRSAAFPSRGAFTGGRGLMLAVRNYSRLLSELDGQELPEQLIDVLGRLHHNLWSLARPVRDAPRRSLVTRHLLEANDQLERLAKAVEPAQEAEGASEGEHGG